MIISACLLLVFHSLDDEIVRLEVGTDVVILKVGTDVVILEVGQI